MKDHLKKSKKLEITSFLERSPRLYQENARKLSL